MKYKIKKILPAQIEVEFENSQRALVFIQPYATPEEIDDAVSRYDSDFQPDPETLINKNISVGEERVSKQKVEEVKEIVEEEEEEFIPFKKGELYGGLPLPTFHKDQIIISYVMADYYMKQQNDDSLKKALDAKIEEYITTNDITVEKALESLMFDDDNLIVDLAEQELANERE
jgi:hypothetical protein